MAARKSGFFTQLLIWCCAIVVVAALCLLILPGQPTKQASVSVKVTPPEYSAPAEPPPPKPEANTVGDEKAQPQVASITPPPKAAVIPPAVDGKPRIAIVIDDVGLDLRDSKRANELPAFITLSYMPYATRLREQTREAREQGHELLLHMPMEPMGHDDPGPGALLVSLSQDELRQRFQAALASFVGFDGVNNHMGSKFTADQPGMEIVIDELQQRKLFFLDSRTSAKSVGESIAREHNLPTIARDVFLDDEINTKAIEAQLERAETVARHKGYAVAIGHPHAATLQVLETWIPMAQRRGFTLVALHDLVKVEQ